MTDIRRYFESGQTSFLTHVTFERRPILVCDVDLFWVAAESFLQTQNNELVAWCILPDHFHAMMASKDGDVSEAVRRFKLKFSGLYRSRHKLKSGRLWQYRFWDHILRDTKDFNMHLDYIHYNPVKHGYVADPFVYEHSSLNEFFQSGRYNRDWGQHCAPKFEDEFGE